MDNSSFWLHLGCVMGTMARQDFENFLEKEGFSKEQQKEFKKQLMDIAKIAYKKREDSNEVF